jgi:hypothetical protein
MACFDVAAAQSRPLSHGIVAAHAELVAVGVAEVGAVIVGMVFQA